MQYYIANSYNDIHCTKKSLKCLYCNVRSIIKPGKFDELQCIIQLFPNVIHLIALTETWVKSEEEANRLKLPGYIHFYNFRQNSMGGGVSLFVHDSLQSNQIDNIVLDDNHYLWVHLDKMSLDIGVIYKPGRTY